MNKYLIIALLIIGVFLRGYALLSVPPSLYWEEAALGYDSYSILKTGRDHHGNFLPIVAFESFGDWKPSLYFYYLVPFIAVFGLSDLAIRVAAVTVGIIVMIGVPVLAKKLGFSSVISLGVVAISPWAVQFSRSAWEANLALALILWGVIFFLNSTKKSMLIGTVFFALSMYAYHSARVISPIIFATLMIMSVPTGMFYSVEKFKKYFKKLDWKKYTLVSVVFIAIISPLIWAVVTKDVSITHRFQETNIFSDIGVIEKSNALKEMSGDSILSRLFYHRYVLFGQEMLKNIFSYFTIDYLILNGDQNLRHSNGFTGLLYPVEIIFILVGIYASIKKSFRVASLLTIWLGISLLPASITTPNPHALRTLISLPVVMLLIAEGVQSSYHYIIKLKTESSLFGWFSKKVPWDLLKITKQSLLVIFVLIYAFQVTAFWRYYTTIYSKQSEWEWQFGYKQLITEINSYSNGQTVYVSRALGRPAMYYWFYSKTDPAEVQEASLTAPMDQSEFLAFKNITYFRSPSEIKFEPGSIIAVPLPQQKDFEELSEYQNHTYSELATIKGLRGENIWKLVSVNDE